MESERTAEGDFPVDDTVGPPPEDELAHLERAAVQPHLSVPPAPGWLYPVVAIAGSAYALSYKLGMPEWLPLNMAASVGIMFVSFHLMKQHGVVPDPKTAPTHLRNLQLLAGFQVLVLAVAMVMVGIWISSWLAVALSGPLFAVIAYLHDRRYHRAAEEIRSQFDKAADR